MNMWWIFMPVLQSSQMILSRLHLAAAGQYKFWNGSREASTVPSAKCQYPLTHTLDFFSTTMPLKERRNLSRLTVTFFTCFVELPIFLILKCLAGSLAAPRCATLNYCSLQKSVLIFQEHLVIYCRFTTVLDNLKRFAFCKLFSAQSDDLFF